MLLSVAGAFAQDVIILRDGEDIQALVQEIGTDAVKYKKFDNPDGPTYTLKKSEIFMIRYVNGSKDVFKDEAPAPPTNQTNVQSQSNNQPDSPIDYNTFLQLRKDDDKMEEFLKTNDRYLYEQFHRGASLRRSGGGLLATGLIFTVAGIVFEVAGSSNNSADNSNTVIVVGGVALAVGQIFIITSIPVSATGGGLKRRATDSYEEKYFNHRTTFHPSLNFGIIGNGVGLALKF